MKGFALTDNIVAAVYSPGFRWIPNTPSRMVGAGAGDLGPVCDWLIATSEQDLLDFDTIIGALPAQKYAGRIDRLLHAAAVTGATFGPASRMTTELQRRLEGAR